MHLGTNAARIFFAPCDEFQSGVSANKFYCKVVAWLLKTDMAKCSFTFLCQVRFKFHCILKFEIIQRLFMPCHLAGDGEITFLMEFETQSILSSNNCKVEELSAS